MMFRSLLFVVAISVLPSLANAQTISRTPIQAPPPGNIQLLPGFVHQRRQGIDSRVGVIYKEGGLSIGYDIGRMAGVYASQYFPEHFEQIRKQTNLNPEAIEREIQFLQDKVEWRQRQKVGRDELLVVFLKDSTLIASFVNSTANFTAKARSGNEIADFLLTVLTYQPNVGKKE